MNNNRPKITISLLVSNRPDTIRRCLDSLQLIREVIPSELILIDTSKNSTVHDILLEYTDQVYEFEWCNDFAKARNEGVRRAKGEWFLYLDDDEWIVDDEEILLFFKDDDYMQYHSANVQIRNFLDSEYKTYSDCWVTRLFYLGEGAHFEGKVHERIVNIPGPAKYLSSMLYHSGYVYRTEEEKRNHFDRNAKILLDLIKEEPEELRWQAQMMTEYCAVEDWNSIEHFCKDRLQEEFDVKNISDKNNICTLYASYIDALIYSDKYEECLNACERACNDKNCTEVLDAFVHLRKGEIYIALEDWRAAKNAVEVYWKHYKSFRNNSSAMLNQIVALLLNRTFEKNYIDSAYNIQIFSELKMGDTTTLQRYVEKLRCGDEVIFFTTKLIRLIVEKIAMSEDLSLWSRLIDVVKKNEEQSDTICAVAQRYDKQNQNIKWLIEELVSQKRKNYRSNIEKESPLLTISLLISNRMDTIPRCLDSLKPIIDKIPCELILIDTSKNLKIHDLLLKYTDQVYNFEWCNDFAKARNEGLKRAKGEWFLFLDDDEWFVETDALVDFFQSGEYREYGYANYQVRNFLDVNYAYYNDCWVSRLVRLDEDVCFTSKIHEYFTNTSGTRKDLQALVYHSGYIYATQEQRRAHFERNQALLLDMIESEPENIRWKIHLVQEYSGVGEWESLIKYCKECLTEYIDADIPYINNLKGTFYTGLVLGCIRLKLYDKAARYASEALESEYIGEVLEAMMRLKLAESKLFLGQIGDAKKEVKEYFGILNRIDLNANETVDQLSVCLSGEVFSKNNQEIAYAILICSELEEGNVQTLVDYYDKLGWSNSVAYTMEGVEKCMVKAMFTLPYDKIFLHVVLDAFTKINLREAFRIAILSEERNLSSEFQEKLYMLSEGMQNVINGPGEDLLEYLSYLQNYVQAVCEWCDYLEKENAVELSKEAVPCYIQAAMCLSDYLEIEEKDSRMALTYIRDAVEYLPEYAEGVGKFFSRYSELKQRRQLEKRHEMDVLRMQVVSQVEEMIHNGQQIEAKQILEQLKILFPGDVEIDILEKRVK